MCADHFEDVLIVEPEEWLGTEEGSSPVYNAEGQKVVDKIHERTRVLQYDVLHSELMAPLMRKDDPHAASTSSSALRV